MVYESNAATALIRTPPEPYSSARAPNSMAALKQTGGKIFGPTDAATLLGMKPTTIVSRLKALGIERNGGGSDRSRSE